MDTTERPAAKILAGTQANEPDAAQFDQDFRPKGAIAFFVLLVTLGLLIWFGIYFLMLQRM